MTQAWLRVLGFKERVRSDSLGHGAPFALHGFEFGLKGVDAGVDGFAQLAPRAEKQPGALAWSAGAHRIIMVGRHLALLGDVGEVEHRSCGEQAGAGISAATRRFVEEGAEPGEGQQGGSVQFGLGHGFSGSGSGCVPGPPGSLLASSPCLPLSRRFSLHFVEAN